MSLPRYLEYKDSDVNWLGEVPGHWEVCRLKNLLIEIDERVASQELELLGLSKSLGVVKRSELEQGASESDNYEKYKVASAGQLVMNKMQAWNGVFGLCPTRGMVSPDYAVFRFIKTEFDKYLCALFRTEMMAGVFFTRCRGMGIAFLRLNTPDLLDIKVPLPPIEEALCISAFLDRETEKIDALIAEQQRLVELLAEKRQAVISHAVTKGLNPNAKVKDSGIEWLGEVPEHWEVGPLKRYWSVTDCKHVTAEFVEDGIPLASIREVQSRWVALEEAKCTTEYFYELLIEGGRRPLPGDLIFSRNATVGEVAQVNSNHPRFAMGQDVVLLRKLSSEYSSDYLQHVIRSPIIILQLANMMIGSTFKRINVEEIRSFIVPFPSTKEQMEIATLLESETERFDTLTAEANRAIELLQERRSALISAAVTGKIDVRENG